MVKKSLLIALSLACLNALAQQPQFTAAGELKRPDSYREWIFLSSGLGMTYGSANTGPERFDNVFVTPEAYRGFLKTGTWPDKTMFVLEIRNSETKGSINKGGHFQEGLAAVEVHLKDSTRFPGKWAFFGFGTDGQTAKALPADSKCQTCHAQNGAVDETFVQFYPTLLPVAKAKGTLIPYK
jgi:hypothetical protein